MIPTNPGRLADYGYVLLIADDPRADDGQAAGGASSLLVPTLYLAAFVWENLLVEQPSVTRLSCSARCWSR